MRDSEQLAQSHSLYVAEPRSDSKAMSLAPQSPISQHFP